MEFRVPQPIVENVQQRWPHHGSAWITAAPTELLQLCGERQLTPIDVLPARYSFVVVVDAPLRKLVLRSTPDPNGQSEAVVAKRMGYLGVGPYIHEIITTGTGIWTVMDRIAKARSLTNETASQISAPRFSQLIQPMLGQSAPAELQVLTEWLRDRLLDDDLADVAPNRFVAPRIEREHALGLLNAMPILSDLCHGDASPGNILTGHNDRLWMVDPRGVAGDVAYDVAVFAAKSAVGVESRLDALITSTGVDPVRARQWRVIADAARV